MKFGITMFPTDKSIGVIELARACEERLAGYCGALVALAILALLTAASNPYALIFILPSVHTWLWLPQVRDRPPAW